MINEYNYSCPHCDSRINRDGKVVMLIKRKNDKHKIFFHPTPFNYDFSCDTNLVFKNNEIIDFYCVFCEESFQAEKYRNFSRIYISIAKNVTLSLYFCRVYGVKKTYVGIIDYEKIYGDEMKQIDEKY